MYSNGATGVFENRNLNSQLTLSSVLTLDSPNSVPFRINDTTASSTNSRMQFQQEGVAVGEIGFISGAMYMRSLVHGADLILRGENDAGSTRNFLFGDATLGQTFIYYDGVHELQTQDSNGTGNSSGVQVKDHSQTYRDVGFNDVTQTQFNESFTVVEEHAGGMAYYNSTSNFTVTLDGSSGNFPTHSRFEILRLSSSGTTSVNVGSGQTLYWFDGNGAPSTGNRTIGAGGWAVLHKYSSNAWFVTGTGLS